MRCAHAARAQRAPTPRTRGRNARTGCLHALRPLRYALLRASRRAARVRGQSADCLPFCPPRFAPLASTREPAGMASDAKLPFANDGSFLEQFLKARA
jgi:hypothetical protein